jgi:hypothetical protein
MVTISESVFRSIWSGVEATVDVPDPPGVSGMRDVLLELRARNIAAAWAAFDKEIKRDGLVLAPQMLDHVARRLFFPYEVMALDLRARAEAERHLDLLQKGPTGGPPN